MPRVKRRPGAQPCNQNARKHGCYSKILSPEEQRLLTIASIPGIDAEIALLRSRIRSLVQEERCPTEPLVRTMQSLCRVVRLKSNLASLGKLRSLAHLQLAALENLSRPVLPALSLIEGSSVEGAKLRERLESKMPITKLVDASQKNLAKQPAIPDTPAE
jgi:hypothetical protein